MKLFLQVDSHSRWCWCLLQSGGESGSEDSAEPLRGCYSELETLTSQPLNIPSCVFSPLLWECLKSQQHIVCFYYLYCKQFWELLVWFIYCKRIQIRWHPTNRSVSDTESPNKSHRTHKAEHFAQKISEGAWVQTGPRQHGRHGSASAPCERGKQRRLQTGLSGTKLGSREAAAGSLQNVIHLKKCTRVKGRTSLQLQLYCRYILT